MTRAERLARIYHCRFCLVALKWAGSGSEPVCCQDPSCRRQYANERDYQRKVRKGWVPKVAEAGVAKTGRPPVVHHDLAPHVIDALLERRARHRRATRTGLRIEGDTTYVRQDGVVCVSRGAWGQRPGSELHHRAVLVGVETGEGL